jgi:hypothetical protein
MKLASFVRLEGGRTRLLSSILLKPSTPDINRGCHPPKITSRDKRAVEKVRKGEKEGIGR